MTGSIEERNKAIVRDAFEALFNRRDFAVAEAFFSPDYIQHSAHIPPGRNGLFELVKSLPSTHQREMGAMVAEGDLVVAHGRLWGYGDGRPNRIVVDIVRIADGLLAEHWDVIEDEASRRVAQRPAFVWRCLPRGSSRRHRGLIGVSANALAGCPSSRPPLARFGPHVAPRLGDLAGGSLRPRSHDRRPLVNGLCLDEETDGLVCAEILTGPID